MKQNGQLFGGKKKNVPERNFSKTSQKNGVDFTLKKSVEFSVNQVVTPPYVTPVLLLSCNKSILHIIDPQGHKYSPIICSEVFKPISGTKHVLNTADEIDREFIADGGQAQMPVLTKSMHYLYL